LKVKIIVLLVGIALLVGILSGCQETPPEEEEEEETPEASFTYYPMEDIYMNTNITFTDASTGEIESWAWEFGDNTTSTEQNPTHAYDTVGTYTVNLTVTYTDGNTSVYSMDITLDYMPPTAAFDYIPMVNITVNATITFTDNSTTGDANITSWLWDFGDDTNSTEQNPTHNYSAADTYTVTLTVTDENELTSTATVDITVTEEEIEWEK